MVKTSMEYISDFVWTFSDGIEDGPSEQDIIKAAALKSKISLNFVVTNLDANPEDEDYRQDYGWKEACEIEIIDTPEFGEGSITFTGIMIDCPVSSGAWYNGNYNIHISKPITIQ